MSGRLKSFFSELRSFIGVFGVTQSLAIVRCLLLYRWIKLFPNSHQSGDLSSQQNLRFLTLPGGRRVFFRANRGDIQSVREVIAESCYRLPDGFVPRVLFDFGANIGLTSLYFAERYPLQKIVAVEPDPSTYAVLLRNLQPYENRVGAVEGAVGPIDGWLALERNSESNLVQVRDLASNPHGDRIKSFSVATLMREHGVAEIDTIKLDIEGFEEQLVKGDRNWMRACKLVIAELHPEISDSKSVIDAFCEEGFIHIPAGSLWASSMTMLVRKDVAARLSSLATFQ